MSRRLPGESAEKRIAMPETPLTHLQFLSLKARGGFEAAGITTLEAAAALSDEEMLALENVGPGTLSRIRDWQAGKPEQSPEKRIRVGESERQGRVWELYKLRLAGGMSRVEALAAAEDDLAAFNGEG